MKLIITMLLLAAYYIFIFALLGVSEASMDKMYTELAKEVMQLREKGTALALENIKCAKKKEGYLSFGTCPKCKRRVSNVEGGNYYQNCGQRLKWED